MKKPFRMLLSLALLALLGPAATVAAADEAAVPAPQKVLRYAFRVAETSFDPTQINDIYSRIVTGHIFEALYTYDHLARPVKFKPLTATALPEATDGWRTWTMKVQPGIFYADDPAFGGKPRELVAEDYVYSLKRFADPAVKSPNWPSVQELRVLGLAELRQKAIDGKRPFDYDTPIEGLQALDRYTLRFTLGRPRPRFAENLAVGHTFGAMAREVVEGYGDRIMEHPVNPMPYLTSG